MRVVHKEDGIIYYVLKEYLFMGRPTFKVESESGQVLHDYVENFEVLNAE